MKRVISTFGIIGGLIVSVLMVISISFTHGKEGEAYGQWLGYTSMVIALSTVFFGVKAFREQEGGILTFGKALLIGLAITLVASLFYVVTWEIYYNFFLSDFADLYMQQLVDHLREIGKSEQEIEQELASTREMMELYKSNTLFRMAMTMSEILPVGIVISLISAAILKKPSMQPKEG